MEFQKKNGQDVLNLSDHLLSDGSVLPLLSYPLLEQTEIVNHCFTTRAGGVSRGIYESLNLSFTRGDERRAVEENFQRLAEAMGETCDSFVFSNQTHTTNVRVTTEEDKGCGLTRDKKFFDTDGMITNVPGIVLSTFYADCVPLFFVDPVKRAIGLAHSGWRGTVGRIGRAVVLSMKQEYGSDPADLICAVGPSICQACYEISWDVAEQFQREFPGQEAQLLEEKGGGKYQLDLWKANEIVLLEAGIRTEHLAVTNICTCCNPKQLFSHRASQGKRGNLGAFLALKG